VSRKRRNPSSDKPELDAILRREDVILYELEKIERELKPKRLSTKAAVRFSGDIMADNALVLNVGQSSTASVITYLADGTTASGAAYSNVVWTFNDPSATVVPNADGITATVTGVAASTGAVSGSVAFTATDTDGVVSQWTQAFTITVNGATPPAQLSQSAAVQFTTPA
jgi:hypothetical protein